MASLNFPTQLKRGFLVVRMIYQTTTADRKILNTGFKVPATKIKGVYKYWDASKQRAKQCAENCDEINEYLKLQETKFIEYLKDCKLRKKAPRIEELTALFTEDRVISKPAQLLKQLSQTKEKSERKISAEHSVDLNIEIESNQALSEASKLYRKFALEKVGDVKKSTFKPYRTFGEQLKEFEQQRAAGPINLNSIDVKFYKEFTRFLIEKQNNVNSTINRKVTRLKTFLNWCLEEGYINVGTYKKKYKLDEVDASKFPLYKEEKDLLYKYIPQAGTESIVYWAFRFALCTGLRYSDVLRLKKLNVQHMDNDGEKLYYISFVEQKTSERTTVPLSTAAIEILSKFDQDEHSHFFNLPTDQECNRTLKDIGKAIGLERICEVKQFQGKELVSEYLPLKDILSFHFARYTYITDLLNNGLSPIYVQNNVGHNKLETTLEYNRDIDKDRLLNTLKIQERIA